MRYHLFIVFFFVVTIKLQATVIECINSEYAGQKLDFFTFTDPVTKEKQLSFSLEFNGDGVASANLKVQKPIFVFSDFGVYRGFLLLETAKKLEISLPPVKEKSFADKKNPYFEPIQFWFKVENENSIHFSVSFFESKISQLTNTYFNQLYYQQSAAYFDTLTTKLYQDGNSRKSTYLDMHKKYRIKSLETDVFRLKAEKVSDIFQETESFFWNHPAFIELFEKTFSNALGFEVNDITGHSVKKAVSEKNINSLLDWIKTKYNLTGNIADMILLKMLHDGFYSGSFDKSAMLSLVSSEYFIKNKNSKIAETAKRTLEKLNHLQPGTRAPVVCLKNIDGHNKCSDKGKEKYKYLVFADTEIGVCREHLKYLSNIYKRFHKHLEIILVMRKTELIPMKIFLVENEIKGEKLVDENGEFTVKYNVKSFPQCFLLDKDHKVVFEDTRAPLDGFEQQFSPFLQNELFQQQRSQSQ